MCQLVQGGLDGLALGHALADGDELAAPEVAVGVLRRVGHELHGVGGHGAHGVEGGGVAVDVLRDLVDDGGQQLALGLGDVEDVAPAEAHEAVTPPSGSCPSSSPRAFTSMGTSISMPRSPFMTWRLKSRFQLRKLATWVAVGICMAMSSVLLRL